ncbi:hypothetical protein E2C01_082902 [Portunus trituberculatus]|uniref:Uncharacterized protein n=1 Tax=Portunus trituberculatus TaxID=210409 RepID=A0A5B7J0I2_PORTR|nr:hypothetical protein [Portunus trituberculatus]
MPPRVAPRHMTPPPPPTRPSLCLAGWAALHALCGLRKRNNDGGCVNEYKVSQGYFLRRQVL